MLSTNPQIYLLVAALLFSVGLYTMLTRKNIIAILLGVELLLNAAGINFLTFSFFGGKHLHIDGHVFTLFIIVLAAAEAVVALALVLTLFRQRKEVEVTALNELRG